MIRIVLVVLANAALFAGLRMLSVLIFFLLGIGASASSEKFTGYILIPALVVQLLIIWLLFSKTRFINSRLELAGLALMSFVLFILGHFNMISF